MREREMGDNKNIKLTNNRQDTTTHNTQIVVIWLTSSPCGTGRRGCRLEPASPRRRALPCSRSLDSTMAAEYREHIEDERLKAVVAHVHARRLAKKTKQKPTVGVDKAKKKAAPREEAHKQAALRVVG